MKTMTHVYIDEISYVLMVQKAGELIDQALSLWISSCPRPNKMIY